MNVLQSVGELTPNIIDRHQSAFNLPLWVEETIYSDKEESYGG
jgi:hypothetical protein